MILINRKNKRAFTLIELLVVIAIIGVLSTLVVVALGNSRAGARDAKRVSDLKSLANALELYYANNNEYPSSITTGGQLTDGTVVYMSKVPENPSNDSGGICGSYDYYYTSSGNDYAISFCLDKGFDNLNKGYYFMSPSGLNGGLVQYYNFEEGSGGSVLDIVGGKTGNWVGSGSRYTNNAKFGNFSGVFNGTNDYITIAGANTYPNFTLSAWIRRPNVANLHNIVSGGGALAYISTHLATFRLYDGQTWRIVTTPPLNADPAWNHVALTFESASKHYKMYVNGVVGYESVGLGTYIDGRLGAIGVWATGTERWFNGSIDDVMLYNRVLSSQEVKALYQAGQ
ncbi:MAG: prepilin-type N-terminal cleavage/methylation domain-containing protein [Patescibacteria group bacterium]|nr:MAG: prepilin-type N-terminal cleavage/methylation domain-containing protein [Patescibacteria group bacterium]